jgi:hypothetical protein
MAGVRARALPSAAQGLTDASSQRGREPSTPDRFSGGTEVGRVANLSALR